MEPSPSPLPARGQGQAGLRAYNERLVLSLLRRIAGLSRAEIARETGLSAQTVSNITRTLEQDGLITSGDPVRGKVGQPMRPLSLAPDGAYGLGLKIGRRNVELMVMTITGAVIARASTRYDGPTPEAVQCFVSEHLPALLRTLPKGHEQRIAGIGVATPYFLWDWPERDATGALDAWRETDVASLLAKVCPFPVSVENDGSASCAAELMFGRERQRRDFLHVFVGAFVGGGVALGGALYRGPRGNAGAIGSMPVSRRDGRPAALIEAASLTQLDAAVRRLGLDPREMLAPDRPWSGFDQALDSWIAEAATAIAQAALGAAALLDLPQVVIDGRFPPDIRARLSEAVAAALASSDCRGVWPPEVTAGTIGPDAPVIGGACLPLLERFLLDQAGAEPLLAPVTPSRQIS